MGPHHMYMVLLVLQHCSVHVPRCLCTGAAAASLPTTSHPELAVFTFSPALQGVVHLDVKSSNVSGV